MFVDSEIYLLHRDNLSSLEGRKHEDSERSSRASFFVFGMSSSNSHDGCNAQNETGMRMILGA